ncbi:unnamed protein product [Linum tenue]|uniref:Uncharacterized protein n=1 Tax=Linum tenue TaxID=586396 RepID=A0AAV0NAE1_9ROSI|nr:unnamed protein product [Linum tenue]
MKASLSKTLNPFYPVSGRVKDNLIIHDFQQGVPFTEARVKGNRLFDFLASPPNLGLLHNLLPSEPFCLAPHHHHHHPLLAVQLNTFVCGGIALGLNMYHKLMDGATTSAFLHTWAANCNVRDPAGSSTILLKNQPELRKPSSVFHPRDPVLVDQCQKAMASMIFPDVRPGGQKATTRRFVFDRNTITGLRARARSNKVTNPTRLETLSAFFWEAALKTSTTTTAGGPRHQLP